MYGDADRRRHPHTDKLCFALAGTKEQGEAPSGARVAQAHSDAGDSRSVYLVARANQERTILLLPRSSNTGFTFYEGGLSPFCIGGTFFDVRSSLNLAPSRGWCGRSEASHGPLNGTPASILCVWGCRP